MLNEDGSASERLQAHFWFYTDYKFEIPVSLFQEDHLDYDVGITHPKFEKRRQQISALFHLKMEAKYTHCAPVSLIKIVGSSGKFSGEYGYHKNHNAATWGSSVQSFSIIWCALSLKYRTQVLVDLLATLLSINSPDCIRNWLNANTWRVMVSWIWQHLFDLFDPLHW